MSKNYNQCMFLGLPSSGKSSFIGAFWHVVESGEIEANYSVTYQPGDREYLNNLRESFLNCTPPERTKTEFIKNIQLSIKDKITDEEIEFVFPDLSGETFSSQFNYRKITEEYVDQIKNCNGIILFINPDHIKKANLISDSFSMLDDEPTIKDDETSPVTYVPWDIKMSQTQVIVVDILQMIKKYVNKPCKISIIVSAWDVIKNLPGKDGAQTPDEWLSSQLPLLKQYVVANETSFLFEVFGVSAQGGSYKTNVENDVITSLQGMIKQSERISVQHGTKISNDITIPIKWMING